MPTLEWIGKNKVINHHQDVPYRVLDKKYTFGTDNESENKIIRGDNLLALKALLPEYEGKIDCIYIDPPYNTGTKEGQWVYSDNVDDPRIRKWIGEVVGKEGEDLSRHDKWLCMMYPRLKLLQKLLSIEGRIFISIDDNELSSLKIICDEIFGSKNFCGQYMWFKSATPPNLSYKIKKNLEYVLCYEKEKNSLKYAGVQKFSSSADPFTKPQNMIKKLVFPENSIQFRGKDGLIKKGVYGTKKFPNLLVNDVEFKNGTNVNKAIFENRFIWVQETLEEKLLKGTAVFLSKDLVLSYKNASYSPEVPPNLIDETVGVNTTEEAGKEQLEMFGKKIFDYPKHTSLIEYLLKFVNKKNAIILDSFAGSGTTAHAVLDLNKQDGGNRKFILVEMMDYAEDITAERVRRVINGYSDKEGLGGDFSFYELGERVLLDNDCLNETLDNSIIRDYVCFMETKKKAYKTDEVEELYLLNVVNDTAYYFFYEKDSVSTLDIESLNSIKTKSDSYVIYADVNTLSEEQMLKFNITYKKIPRDIAKL